MKKTVCILLCVAMLAAALTGFTACGKSDANTFSYMLYQGNNKYDTTYSQNVQAEWWASKEWLGEKITLDFMIPSKSSSATETMATLIASGDYPDIVDYNALNTMTFEELYKDGVIMDVSEYVKAYMPNYLKYLEENPEMKPTATTLVDGKPLYLSLVSYDDQIEYNSWSLSYRRDWILKYGKNPVTGEAFTGGYDENGEWSDNIVFPNGENVPIYISDWEWMFEIFTVAIKDLGLEGDPNSYCISIPYSGSDPLSGINGAFNTNASFCIRDDGVAELGITTEKNRVYYECMSNWYKKGWIDKAFKEHSGDLPYKINASAYASGKVGAWFGQIAYYGDSINDPSTPYQDGAYVMVARPPHNDVYGEGTEAFWDAETNNFSNGHVYGHSKIVNTIVITTKAADKNLPALFTMLDSAYGEEGSMVHYFGFNKEQQAEFQNELYIQEGMEFFSEPAFDENGEPILNAKDEQKQLFNKRIRNDQYLETACKGHRLFGLSRFSMRYEPRPEFLQLSYDESMNYVDDNYIKAERTAAMPAEISKIYADVGTYILNEGELILYKFVNGEMDASKDEDWNKWLAVFDREYKNGMTYNDAIAKILAYFND